MTHAAALRRRGSASAASTSRRSTRFPGSRTTRRRAAAQDAYRQTQFVLGGDLRLFAEGMELQLRILNDSSHSRYRTHVYAAVVSTWSRAYTAMADACLLVTRGSYASVPNLVRSACELIAAEYQVQREEMGEYVGWLLAHLKPDEEHKAFDVGLGHYFAGTTLAADERAAAGVPRGERPRAAELRGDAAADGPESNNRGSRTPSPTRRFTSPGRRSSWAGCCGCASGSWPWRCTCATCSTSRDETHAAYRGVRARGCRRRSTTRAGRGIEEVEEGEHQAVAGAQLPAAAVGRAEEVAAVETVSRFSRVLARQRCHFQERVRLSHHRRKAHHHPDRFGRTSKLTKDDQMVP